MPLSDETAPAHFSADHTLSFGQSGTPGEFFCTPFFCAPLVRVTPGASTSHQDATGPFLRPAPTSSQAIFTAFDLNVKASNSSTRDTPRVSTQFLPTETQLKHKRINLTKSSQLCCVQGFEERGWNMSMDHKTKTKKTTTNDNEMALFTMLIMMSHDH